MDMHRLRTNGIELGVAISGEGPAVMLCHGWPELAYSWSNQIPALNAAGYRTIAPDLRGFGGSDAPDSGYSVGDISADLIGLLEALDLSSAVFVGHDWGGAVVWGVTQRYPDQVRGVVSLNTPHYPVAPVPPISIQRRRHGDNHYWVHFQEPGAAEELFEGDVERFFRTMFRSPASADAARAFVESGKPVDLRSAFERGPGSGDVVMSEKDLDVYIETYKRTGFRGGLNYYRSMDMNWEQSRDLDPIIRHPALMISAELDVMLPPSHTEWMQSIMPDLEFHVLEGVGHWAQWEAPEDVNRLLVGWLERRFPPA
ncbi:MAG: alpha/beta hydrolase [Acidimicrobiia bacterium]|nr:alpha/beta hydrolase [Acidimicrobiia bacterium]